MLVVAGLVVAGAGCGNEYERGAGVYTAPERPPGPAARDAPALRDGGTGEGSEARPDADRGRLRSPSARRAVARARGAARAFLAGYLPYSYGHARASRIRAATPRLGEELAESPPRVPPAARARGRAARVRELQVAGVDRARVTLLADIADGRESYAALLTVSRQRDGRWLVGEVR